MADTLQIGISGLLAAQSALATTSHNISNVNTPGYSRQRVELVARPPTPKADGFIGNGVRVDTVARIYNQFLVGQLRTNTTLNSQYSTFADYAGRVDNLLADPKAGLSPTLQEFFKAVQGVADAPSSTPARQVLLSQSNALVDRYRYLYNNLNAQYASMNTQTDTAVSEVNQLAKSLAKLNQQIVTAQGQAAGQPANDLLDQRDELIRQLSEKVAVSVVPQSDGSLNVFIGNGQTLVIGYTAATLSTRPNGFDPNKKDILIGNGTGTPVNITDSLKGGVLGALQSFRQQILNPALNSLGRVAINLADAFNAQHKLGLDLNNNLGGTFFNVPTPTVLANTLNTTNATPTVTITDPGQLSNVDYRLQYDGTTSTWSLINTTTNKLVTSGSGATPLTADGLSIAVSAIGAVPGNSYSFEIQPTRNAARDISVAITDPRQIAAAGAVRASAATTNLGSATISAGQVNNPADPNFLATATITFSSSTAGTLIANQYSINGGAPVAYTSGANIDVNGMRVQITGKPYVNDTFTVEKNTGAVSDNRNALALGDLQTTPTMLKNTSGTPTTDFQSAYAQIVSAVGTQTHQADINQTAQKSVLQQSVAQRDAVSGVNLDQEAANMLRFQQAYQATARIIATSNQLFTALMTALGG